MKPALLTFALLFALPTAARPATLFVAGTVTSTTGALPDFGLKVGSHVYARAFYGNALLKPVMGVEADGLAGVTGAGLGDDPSGHGLTIRAGRLVFNASEELGGNVDANGYLNYPRALFQGTALIGFSTVEQNPAGDQFISFLDQNGVITPGAFSGYDNASGQSFAGVFDVANARIAGVPEPAALALLGLGALALSGRKHAIAEARTLNRARG